VVSAGDGGQPKFSTGDWLTSTLARLIGLTEARSAVKAGRALDPAFTISRARAVWSPLSDHPAYLTQLEPIIDALREAGLPEE